MTKHTLLLAATALLALAGCQTPEGNTPKEKFHSRMRAKPVPVSAFLPDQNLLVRQSNMFPFHYFYLKPNPGTYSNVHVAPVDVSHLRASSAWAEFDKKMNGKLGDNIQELAAFMQKAYVQAFEKNQSESHLTVTEDATQPNTLIVEPALIALAPTKAELNVIGSVASFAVPGIGAVASLLSAGSITVECRIRDAQTNEIIAMYGNTENDPKALIAPAGLTWLTSARINIKTMAAHTAQVLSAKDYRAIKREFPIRFAARIVDGNLDGDK